MVMPEQNYTQEIEKIWQMVKNTFRDTLSESTVKLWFDEITILAYEDDRIDLGIPSEFKFKIVNEKYLGQIREFFSKLLGFDVKVNLMFTGNPNSAVHLMSEALRQERAAELGYGSDEERKKILAPDNLANYHFEYTFENFIVGSTNKFAQAACMAVADHPATNYNPLFIYGNSGLGKTHLMYAIINRMKQNNPRVRIMYTNGEDFMNQMIACLATKTMEDFRDKFRKCDVLLIDDIQFIAGKIAIQEEFFHTFNALFELRKQIILTSDRPPRDIKTLEDRLKSRFEWGLLADIEPPDLELRIAIIKKKAEQVNVTIPDEVLTFLGENLRSNIRQIEGAIKKLGALTFLSGHTITMELAQRCLAELLGGEEPVSTTVDRIFDLVERRYGVSHEDLIGNKRSKEIAFPRHLTIYLIREITEMSYPNIAKLFSRDHTTIISSYDIIQKKTLTDPSFQLEVNELKNEILGK